VAESVTVAIAQAVTPVSSAAVQADPSQSANISTPQADAVIATMPVVTNYTLPVDSLLQIAQSSGLVWVNSDSAKVAAVQAAIAAEPQPVRVPRERPPAVVLNEGPLVLVETRKDLNTLQVPF
jgi:ribonuclease E